MAEAKRNPFEIEKVVIKPDKSSDKVAKKEKSSDIILKYLKKKRFN